MAFTRKTLSGYGLTDEQLEKVMTLYSTSLSEFIPKGELQAKIDEAVEKAKKELPPPDVTTSEEYMKVAGERDMLRALNTEDFASVKPKFREAVYNMLDHKEGAQPVKEQLKTIAEGYEEYFEPTEGQPKPPQFGANVSGQMPKGDQKNTISDIWFGKKQ